MFIIESQNISVHDADGLRKKKCISLKSQKDYGLNHLQVHCIKVAKKWFWLSLKFTYSLCNYIIDLDMIHPFESKRGMTSIAVERLEFNVMMLKAIKTSLLHLCVR